MGCSLTPVVLLFTLLLIVAHSEGSPHEFPRLTTPLLYSAPSTVLNACLSVNITFKCQFVEGRSDISFDGVIWANEKSIIQEWTAGETLSFTYNATILNSTHPITNFTCGEYRKRSTKTSNVIRIKFYECHTTYRPRTHRILAGKSIKLLCPFDWGMPIDWDLDGYPVNESMDDGDQYRPNANGSSLSIRNLTSQDSGVYRCFVKPDPMADHYVQTMSHEVFVLTRGDRRIFPDRLELSEIDDTSVSVAWTIETENRACVKRLVDRSEPFVICYASLSDEIVKNVTVSSTNVSIRFLTPGTIFAIRAIGKEHRCFERGHQDNVQFFSTLSPGERMERRDLRAVYIVVEGEKKILYCLTNLDTLKTKDFNFTWYNGVTRIVSNPNGRRKIDPKTGALIFDKAYHADSGIYTCMVNFRLDSGLIDGDHTIEVAIDMDTDGQWRPKVGFENIVYAFECTNITASSISIDWRVISIGWSESSEDNVQQPSPRPWFKVLFWEMEGMGDQEALDVRETNATINANGTVVLENLNADALYIISVSDTNGKEDRTAMADQLRCWTEPIHDTLE